MFVTNNIQDKIKEEANIKSTGSIAIKTIQLIDGRIPQESITNITIAESVIKKNDKQQYLIVYCTKTGQIKFVYAGCTQSAKEKKRIIQEEGAITTKLLKVTKWRIPGTELNLNAISPNQ